MIITLTFDDEKEDELEKFNKMMKAQEILNAIDFTLSRIRDKLKFEELNEEQEAALEEVRGLLWTELKDRNLADLLA